LEETKGLSFLKRLLLGKPKDPLAPDVFHKVTLGAFLAWVGLGSDGLSSSAYGPDEAFRALGQYHYLAIGLAIATAFTVFIISYAYSRIIEHFPSGGGGYVVASQLLGRDFGVVSGCALIVDYVLTISVSIAAAADAFFSFLPPSWHTWKLFVEFSIIGWFLVMNLRGVKESVTTIMPIFVLFLITHAIVIFGTIAIHAGAIPIVSREVHLGFQTGAATLGLGGLAAIFLRAYSMGAGTYTGIEAVSNGLQIMREPTVATGRRTMLYMALSLAITAGGILICYLLTHAAPVEGQTMNAVMIDRFASSIVWAGLPVGRWFVIVTLSTEAAILFIAAQTGFIDGPRVMANMAGDSWLPHSFTHLSDRLTVQNGVVLISAAALFTLLYTRGETSTLVLMYSINVFLTFSLSESGMVRYWIRHRASYPAWSRHIVIHIIGLILCLSILVVSLFEKFDQGGWVTIVITSGVIGICYVIRSHYIGVQKALRRLDDTLMDLPFQPDLNPVPAKDVNAPTAVIVVRDFDGVGIHTLLNIPRLFPHQFKNVVFISVGVIDSGRFKGIREMDNLRLKKEEDLKSFVEYANCLGWYAEYRYSLGVDLMAELEKLCKEVSKEFPRSVFFGGKLVFGQQNLVTRALHNHTPSTLQERLQFEGLQMVVVPIRVSLAAELAA